MMSEIGVFFLSKSWSWCSEISFFFDLRKSWNGSRCFVGSAGCGNTTILVLKLVDCGRLRGFWNHPNHIHHHHGHLGGKSWVECKFFITTTRKRLWWSHRLNVPHLENGGIQYHKSWGNWFQWLLENLCDDKNRFISAQKKISPRRTPLKAFVPNPWLVLTV